MTGNVGVDCGTQGHLRNIGQSRNFESYICGFRQGSRDREMSSQWATGQERSRCRCEYMGGYRIKSTVGSEMETVGLMGKSKETAGTESGADTEVVIDLKSTADQLWGLK